MIGKHIANTKERSSFKTLGDYITGKGKRQSEDGEKIAYSDCLNLASVETATLEMESLAFQNKRCKDPVMHLLLSWRENETPTREQVLQAVQITLDELNLSSCQTLYSLHQNTDNLHLHICVNRIDPDTHRAITPAGGWTRRAMEHAARRIEAAQGWQVEENTWSEVNELGEVVQKPREAEAKIPQRVQDAENQTGEQSAVRKAQMVLKDAAKSVSSWDELHALMHNNGLAYRKKGSGAVIQIGEVTMKASAVSRNLTLKNLEKRLGAYQPPQENMKSNVERVQEMTSPKPLDEASDNKQWRSYIAARNEHYGNKKQIRQELKTTHKSERQALKERHRAERAAFWRAVRGKGFKKPYIDRQSSLLAARHAAETALLKKEHKAQREQLRQTSSDLASYESWLHSRGLSDEADSWRHRRNKKQLELHAPHDAHGQNEQEQMGILGFRVQPTANGVKFYSGDDNQASFVDVGQRIRVYRHDDESLLAALQLAQEKWGGVELSGSDEYKRRCAEIAAKNGIRIVNPELREMAAATETPEERMQRMAEISKTLRQKAMEVARRYIPQGMIIMTDAQDGRTYSGIIIGVVSSGEHVHTLQMISENHVIQHSVDGEEREQMERIIGRDVTITYRGGRIARVEDSMSLRNQRSVGRGR